jgi:hypothetical protein
MQRPTETLAEAEGSDNAPIIRAWSASGKMFGRVPAQTLSALYRHFTAPRMFSLWNIPLKA